MRCPTLSELPPPPLGKTGWPWTEESPQLPDTMPDGCPWPRVSIVTPSYNQGQFIEETIRSVLLQGYPDLEYIIIDGGSTDESVDIIRKYEKWLAYWVSEPDRGQSDAINKGWEKSTGDILAWLNSDDVYEPSAIKVAVYELAAHPDWALVYGSAYEIDEADRIVGLRSAIEPDLRILARGISFNQPSTFIRRGAVTSVAMLDTSLHYCMDYDLWLRIALKYRFGCTNQVLSRFRLHPLSKGSQFSERFEEDAIRIAYKILKAKPALCIRAGIHAHLGYTFWRRKQYARAGWHFLLRLFNDPNPLPFSARLRLKNRLYRK